MTVIRPSDEYLAEPYYKYLAGGTLHLNCCNDCGSAHHPPSPICPTCRSFNTGWKPATGRATLNSFAVARHPVHPMLEPKVPYVITLVDLEEGVRLVSGIPEGMSFDLRVGMPLECKVISFDDDFALPYFLPVGEEAQ